MMPLVVVGLVLVLLVLKPKLRPLVPLHGSSFPVLVMFLQSIPLKKPLIKSFLSRINSGHITKAENELPSSSTNGRS